MKSEVLLNAQSSKENLSDAWVGPDNKNVFIANTSSRYIKIIDINTGNTKDFINLNQKMEFGDHDNVKSIKRINDAEMYIVTKRRVYKFNMQDFTIEEVYSDLISTVHSHNSAFDDGWMVDDCDVDKNGKIVAMGGFHDDGGDDPYLAVVNIETGNVVVATELGNENQAFPRVAVSPDGTKVAYYQDDYGEWDKRESFANVIDVSAGMSSKRSFYGHSTKLTFIKFLDNNTIVTGDEGGEIHKWNADTTDSLEKYNMNRNDRTTNLIYFGNKEDSKVNTSVTNTGDDLTFELSDTYIKKDTLTVYEDGVDITSDISSIDYIAGTVTFASTHTGTITADYVFTLNTKADGNKVVTCGETAKFFHKETKTLINKLDVDGFATDVAFTKDYSKAVVISTNGTIKIIDFNVDVGTLKPKTTQHDAIEFRGNIYNMGGYSSLDCYFEYSTDPNFETDVNESNKVTVTEKGKFGVKVEGLNSSTDYYYKAKVTKTTT